MQQVRQNRDQEEKTNSQTIRFASSEDVEDIYRIMMDAKAGMEHPERYFTDSPEFIRDVIEKKGYSLIFEVNGEIAGFLNMIRKEDAETERFLRLAIEGLAGADIASKDRETQIRKPRRKSQDEMTQDTSFGTGETASSSYYFYLEALRSAISSACMFADSCAVDSCFRGRGIQYRLLRKAEEIERKRGTRILLTTVHPENIPSVKSILKAGYELVLTSDNLYENHAGQVRNLMIKVIH